MHLVSSATDTRFDGWPHFDESDIRIVEEVLRSGKVNYWTGDEGRQFEREYAAYVGSKHAIALANGTVALELALRALGVGPGDEVITTSRAFIACASCVVAVGATPIFADVDRESQNITVATIRASITPRTRAIIAVHLAGLPCNMDAILAVGKDHGIRVIEDCAQAHGARYKGSPVGSFGDIGTFSFCQDKIISTGGEGGMITLNDDAHWSFAWSFKDHGKDFNAAQRDQQTEGIRWVHESPGTNWRLTEMQSALGRNALRRLDGWVETRRRNAEILKSSFGGLQVLRVPKVPPEYYHSYYKFYAFLETGALKPGWTRDRIVYEMSAAGVPCSAGGCGEIHLEKAFASGKERQARTPVARELAETSLMFLVHPTLSVEDMDCIASSAVRALRVAAR